MFIHLRENKRFRLMRHCGLKYLNKSCYYSFGWRLVQFVVYPNKRKLLKFFCAARHHGNVWTFLMGFGI